MHLSEDEIALFSAFVLMSAGRCQSQLRGRRGVKKGSRTFTKTKAAASSWVFQFHGAVSLRLVLASENM